jgi:Arc/MetJ-type ribon-helix-helix transcriptional regulator
MYIVKLIHIIFANLSKSEFIRKMVRKLEDQKVHNRLGELGKRTVCVTGPASSTLSQG